MDDKERENDNPVGSSTSGTPGSNTMNGAGTGSGGLDGDYVPGNPENVLEQMERARQEAKEEADNER
jgi:hypothetical protein